MPDLELLTLLSRAKATSVPLSYAQNLEDYHLSLAFAGQPTGTYIDIGGGHPVAGSVSFWFYERGWQGLVVEPQEPLASLHRHVRPRDTVVSGLIGAHSGSANLFVVERLHALTTTIEAYADNAKNYGAGVRSVDGSDDDAGRAVRIARHRNDRLPEDRRRGRGSRRYRRRRLAPLSAEGRGGRGDQAAVRRAGLGARGRECCSHTATGSRCSTRSTGSTSPRASRYPGAPAAERAPWDAVRHMYEIGRAGENPVHPDHQLAFALVHGFLARLPHLAPELLASLLDRENRLRRRSQALQRMLADEALRMRLGRIACGYDGGQIVEGRGRRRRQILRRDWRA